MGKIADRIYTDQGDIARLEARTTHLPAEAIVELTMDDGRKLKGLVTVQPTVQTFRNAEGQEGANSLLRLDDLQHPGQSHYLWLDQVRDIFHLGSD